MKINWHSHDNVIQRVLSDCQSHCLCSSEWKLDSVLFEFWSLSPNYFESISYTSHHLTPIQTVKSRLALHRQLFESHQLQLEMDEKEGKWSQCAHYFGFSSWLLLCLCSEVESAMLLGSGAHNIAWVGSQEMAWLLWTPLEIVVVLLLDPTSSDALLTKVRPPCANPDALVRRSGQKLCKHRKAIHT